MKEENKFLNAKQVSKILGIHKRTVQRLTKEGRIKGIRVGKLWKYTESDINQYLVNGANQKEEYIPSPIPLTSHALCVGAPGERGRFIERRAYPRINCHIECMFSVDLPNKNSLRNGIIRNISANGLLAAGSGTEVSVEDPVNISFVLHQDRNTPIAVEIRGRVVRRIEDGFGIKFRNIDKVNQEEIINYVG